MNSITTINTINNNTITISSLEIAQITGKTHKNVLADIRNMLESLNIHSAEFSAQYKDSTGRTLPCFNLPKRETLILMSGYDLSMRAKIIDRWEELELAAQAPAQAPALPTNFKEALLLLVEAEEVKEAQALQITHLTQQVEDAAPAINLHTVISNSDQAISMSEFANVVKEKTGLGRNKMFKKLRDLKILQPNNVPYATHTKYFKTIETTRHGRIIIVTLVRIDGQQYLINKLAAN